MGYLFNKSLYEDQVPMKWKEAHVCAVFKKGDPSSVSLNIFYCQIFVEEYT